MHADASTNALIGGRCTGCGRVAYPRRIACRECGSKSAEVNLSGRADLYSYTTVRVAPSGFEAPYVLAYAVMDEGPRALVRIDDPPPQLAIGDRLELRRSELTIANGARSHGLEAVVTTGDRGPDA